MSVTLDVRAENTTAHVLYWRIYIRE